MLLHSLGLFAEPVDDMSRADVRAVSAADALGGIHRGEIVFYDYRVRRALSLALHAADTAEITDLNDSCALVFV